MGFSRNKHNCESITSGISFKMGTTMDLKEGSLETILGGLRGGEMGIGAGRNVFMRTSICSSVCWLWCTTADILVGFEVREMASDTQHVIG